MENSASQMIDQRIRELDDWRGSVLKRVRELIHEADPEVVEEWKWVKESSPFNLGVPKEPPAVSGIDVALVRDGRDRRAAHALDR